MTMGEKQEFTDAWNTRFPEDQHPTLDCFDGVQSREKLEKTLKSHQDNIKYLQKELHKNEFIANFLWEKLHKSNINLGAQGHGSSNLVTRLNSTGILETDLDSSIPSGDEQFGKEVPQEYYQNVTDVKPGSTTPQTHGQVDIPKNDHVTLPAKNTYAPVTINARNVNSTSHGETHYASTQIVFSERDQSVKKEVVTTKPSRGNNGSFSSFKGQNNKELGTFKPSLSRTASLPTSKCAGVGNKPNTSNEKPAVPTPQQSSFGPKFSKLGTTTMEGIAENEGKRDSTISVQSIYPPPDNNENEIKDTNIERADSGTFPRRDGSIKERPMIQRKPKKELITQAKLRASTTGETINQEEEVKVEEKPKPKPPLLKVRRPPRHDYEEIEIQDEPPKSKLEELGRRGSTPKLDENKRQSNGLGVDIDDLDGAIPHTPEGDYDDPIPVDKTDGGESSESEDDCEELYVNILLMKKQQERQYSQPLYASVDLQKKNLDKKARRLSRKFSDGTIKELDKLGVPNDDIKTGDSAGSHGSVFVYPEGARSPSFDAGIIKEDSENPWRKRQSMLIATKNEDAISIGSSDHDELESAISSSFDHESTEMRKMVASCILDGERQYVAILDVLSQYMRSLEGAAKSSQPVISEDDIKTIFSKIPDLHQIHSEFIHSMDPLISKFDANTEVGGIFKIMILKECDVATYYLKNYQKSIRTIQKCSEESPQFLDLTREIKLHGSEEKSTLEEMLHKPVVRIQRNLLVLHDLIRCTPTGHADYDMLQKTLKVTQQFLENVKDPTTNTATETQRYLVKNGMIVEKVSNSTKLRHVFLFNDVIVCTKQKVAKQKVNFEVKWFIPLHQLLVDNRSSVHERESDVSKQLDLEELQKRVSKLQSELRHEMRKNKSSHEGATGRNWSFRGTRTIEKIRKKLIEQETQLVLKSPRLVFKLRNEKSKKNHTLLMSSDYERMDWGETINGLKGKVKRVKHHQGLNIDVLQNMLDTMKMPRIYALGAMLHEDVMMEEEQIFGSLTVTIHKFEGLKKPCNTYCCVELDTCGHFFMKAKTCVMKNTATPTWNEEFDIDLEGAQTLRILVYNEENNALMGKCALELSKSWLKGDFQHKTITISEELSLTMSLRYASNDQTLRRTPSHASTGVFGVRIEQCAKREGKLIPMIVTACIQEVENRGMDDVGIYRISGLTLEIQRFKKAFERNSKGAAGAIKDADINVVTSLLKLYFRELPEALFTDTLYPKLIDTMGLSDPEAKAKVMIAHLKKLPRVNYETVIFVLNHLIKVSKSKEENKMSVNNLATVFGPTLLRPAVKDSALTGMEMFSACARDAMMQTGILQFLLSLKEDGVEL